MARVTIPDALLGLLAGSPLEAETLEFADRASVVLRSNQMPFFPAYTDHGVRHVEGILEMVVLLIPPHVLGERSLLGGADAAVVICAAILHDIAMHLHEDGFVQLIERGAAPLGWFDQPHEDRAADPSWSTLWETYKRELRHIGRNELTGLLGSNAATTPDIVFADTLDSDRWRTADRLVIGEFLRRHHARLAHEVAVRGFVGVQDDWPGLSPALADPAGVVARSHGEDLRAMAPYLEYEYGGALQPAGARLPYLMALLRIADYLQLEGDRAPSILLRLRNPSSPFSVGEWEKHAAIARVGWEQPDPLGIRIDVTDEHTLRTHLALSELFDTLRRELDSTVATLSQIYRAPPVDGLRLSRERIYTNLDSEALHRRLSYVPMRAALRSDEDLFRLVVGDLYGNNPVVAIREMLQNAVDAVRERRRVELRRGRPATPDTEPSVDVEIVQSGEHAFELRVTDQGVGMTPQTVVDFYLKAGATLGPSAADREGLSMQEQIRTLKAGRFGIGAFASFLLGPVIHVTTRHLDAREGIEFTADIEGDMIELQRRPGAPIGTRVSVAFEGVSTDSVLHLLKAASRLYHLRDPLVSFAVRFLPERGDAERWLGAGTIPEPAGGDLGAWRSFDVEGFDAILWHPDAGGRLVQDGIEVVEPPASRTAELRNPPAHAPYVYEWKGRFVSPPCLAVFGGVRQMGLTLTRYALVDRRLPFRLALLDAIGADIVAWALAGGTEPYPLVTKDFAKTARGREGWLPLLPELLWEYTERTALIVGERWDMGAVADEVAWVIVDKSRILDARSPGRHHNIVRETREWVGELGGRHLATLVAVDITEGTPKLESPGGWRSFADDSLAGHVVGDEAFTATLKGLARRCLANGEPTAADPFPREGTALSLVELTSRVETGVARAWLEWVRGPMPHDAGERRALAERIVAQEPAMARPVADWESRSSKSSRTASK